MAEGRPDPDALLARVEREEARAGRGRLKVFFGASPGVGKTYTMLEAARERRAEGVDVVVGLVETHGRRETAALLEGLEVLPTRNAEHRGIRVREFDLDGALARRPALILVDELAHSNASGSRHPKRWRDVQELLDAGINVYTTLNVQHLESLNDDIGRISGIRIRETVPDTVFEAADEVELVDLPPDELLTRLREGKVYLPEQARRAIENFFRKGNLIALRELALRQTASRVDADMQDYREDHAIREVWQVGERILVCIGPDAMAERLVRSGKRLAVSLHAEWIVVYVETPGVQKLGVERRDAVLRVLRLAERLGAETITLSAPNASDALLELARNRNVGKILMGKGARRGWRRWLLGSVVDDVVAGAEGINIYLQSGSAADAVIDRPGAPNRSAKAVATAQVPALGPTAAAERMRGHLWAVATMAVCTAVARLMFDGFDLANLVMVYLLGTIFVALRFGRGPSILAAVLGVAAYDWMFVTPYFSFTVADTQYLFTLAAMLVTAMVISNLMVNVRYQARVAGHRERRATALYAMSHELSGGRTEHEIVSTAVRHIHAEFGCPNVVLLADAEGRVVYPDHRPLSESLSGADLGVAQWVLDHAERAGKGTDTLAGASAVYFPVGSAGQVIGVLAMLPINLRRIYLPEQQKLLDTLIALVAQAIERVRLAEQARTASVQVESERLRNSLLSSISHDLRTPLATIVGSASTLVAGQGDLADEDRRELSQTIHDEALRMTNLVNNILDMARLDSGAIRLNKEWHPLDEVVGTVLTRLQRSLLGRVVEVALPTEIPMIHADAVMIEQVLANLIENAVRHTPPGSPISLSAEASPFTVSISVADRGPGIPKGLEDKLFEKFYRVQRESAQSGVGLGLAICKAIVEAHGGWIGAKNRGTGGAVFTFGVPLDESPPPLMGGLDS
ncbi:MAG: sensor histidine kinase KdpD [Methylotetracoccus sp.]